MSDRYSFDEDEFQFPLQITTHERCSLCGDLRGVLRDCEQFESRTRDCVKIETGDGEPIAKYHESVDPIVAAVAGEDLDDETTCGVYDCEAEATHTVEVDARKYQRWKTMFRCSECVDPDGRSIRTVYDDLSTKACGADRCRNLVHESRDYCSSHESEE